MVGVANTSLQGIFSEHAGAVSIGLGALDNRALTNGEANLNSVLRVSDSIFSLRVNAELMGVLSGSLAGIVNANTQKVQNTTFLKNSRTVRQILDQIMVAQITEDLGRLRELQHERNELISEINEIESRYLTEEQRTQAPGESDEEFFERRRRLLQQAVENGDMSQEEFDRWLEMNTRLLAVDTQIHQILDRWRENDAEVLAFRELQKEERELTGQLNGLDAKIVHNEGALSRLRGIRAMDAERADVALGLILSDYPELASDVPAHLDVYEQIDFVEQAIAAETDAARIEQVEVQQEIEVVQAATTTVLEAAGDRVDPDNLNISLLGEGDVPLEAPSDEFDTGVSFNSLELDSISPGFN